MASHYLFKLIPPRPSFAHDMTEEERALMEQHADYWRGLLDQGIVLVFGPVFDPKGPYGVAIATAEDEAAALALTAEDPVVKAQSGFAWEVLPMQVVTRNLP
jgi:uncharacterized protein YciI